MISFFVIVVWLLLCILIGKCAGRWNRSFLKYFILSLLFSPLIMGIILLIMGKKPVPVLPPEPVNINKYLAKECGTCKGTIPGGYTSCPNCGISINSSKNNGNANNTGRAAKFGENKYLCPHCKSEIKSIYDDFIKTRCNRCNQQITKNNVIYA